MSLQVWLPLNGDLNNLGLNGNIVPTATNTTIISAGKTGPCYQFGTAISYITIPKEAMTSLTTEASVCFWLKIISWNTSYATYFQAGLGSTAWAHYIFGFLRNNANSTCCFTISNGSSASNASYLTPAFDLNKWYHVTLVYKTGHCLIYIDGQLYQDYTTSIVPNFSGITTITTGICNNKSSYQTNCQMNDIRIYNHALSPKEVKEIAKGLVLHYKLDNNGLGRYNLYRGTYDFSESWNGSSNWTTDTNKFNGFTVKKRNGIWGGLSQNIYCSQNDIFTISFFAKVDSGGRILSIHRSSLGNVTTGLQILNGNFSNGSTTSGIWVETTDDGTQWKRYWATVKITQSDITYLQWRIENSVADKYLYIAGFKMEEGPGPSTGWCPHLLDDLDSIFNWEGNQIYDVSGYGHNGAGSIIPIRSSINVASSLEYIAPSPRYSAATKFNSINETYIKVNENKWMAQGSQALTINVWAYMDDWTAWNGHRLYSCTEGGGFNIENTVANSLTFPVCVYTNAAQTSTGYIDTNSRVAILKTDLTPGWHMFTYIYEITGCSCYLDGELYQTKAYTSYGIYYNLNSSRLFLGCEANGVNPSGPYFNGCESDFRIYVTALSENDIKELYHTSASIDSNGNIYAREVIEI